MIDRLRPASGFRIWVSANRGIIPRKVSTLASLLCMRLGAYIGATRPLEQNAGAARPGAEN